MIIPLDMGTLNGISLRAILFDFDGVIAESVDVKTKAFAKLYENYGKDIIEKVVSHHLSHGGISRFDKIRFYHKQYLGRAIDDVELSLLCKRFSDMVLDNVLASPFVPGVVATLERIYKEYDCFIVSGTPQEELELIVREKGIAVFFKGVHGAPLSKQDGIERIRYTFQFDPREMVYIGDSITDYDAAKATKVNFIGRVPQGTVNPFPPDVPIVRDFN